MLLSACGNSSPTSPAPFMTASSGSGSPVLTVASGDHGARPIKGTCETVITPLDPASAGACTVFEPVPSAFITITGQCQVAHLGRVSLAARQQLLFLLDAQGQPIIVNGQPVVSALRNCGVLQAADVDELIHTTTGTVAPGAAPGTVSFQGALTFTGGTGRFTEASGLSAFSGSASLLTNTGAFTFEGTINY
jgi:hypothetical protein